MGEEAELAAGGGAGSGCGAGCADGEGYEGYGVGDGAKLEAAGVESDGLQVGSGTQAPLTILEHVQSRASAGAMTVILPLRVKAVAIIKPS